MNRPHLRAQVEPGGSPAAATPSFQVDPFDPTVARLHRYRAATEVDPPDGLRATVASRIAREPASTPTRRFFTALRAQEAAATLRAFRQSLATALGSGTAKAAVRAQAAFLVAAVIVATSISGVAAVASAGAGLEVVSAVARDVLSPKHEKAKPVAGGPRASQAGRASSGQDDPSGGKPHKANPVGASGPADSVKKDQRGKKADDDRKKADDDKKGGKKADDGKKGGKKADDDKKGGKKADDDKKGGKKADDDKKGGKKADDDKKGGKKADDDRKGDDDDDDDDDDADDDD